MLCFGFAPVCRLRVFQKARVLGRLSGIWNIPTHTQVSCSWTSHASNVKLNVHKHLLVGQAQLGNAVSAASLISF